MERPLRSQTLRILPTRTEFHRDFMGKLYRRLHVFTLDPTLVFSALPQKESGWIVFCSGDFCTGASRTRVLFFDFYDGVLSLVREKG